nr:unnamed protein product [Spirometra erinaceieuropaei]
MESVFTSVAKTMWEQYSSPGSAACSDAGTEVVKFFAIHPVEGFRQIYESRVPVAPHLLTILLQLTEDEDYVRGPTMTAKAALTCQQKTMFQVAVQAVEKDSREDPPDDVQQRDASVIVAEQAVIFPLIQMADCGVPEILPDFSLKLPLLE